MPAPRTIVLSLLLVATAALAGCGGGSGKPAAGTPQNPLVAKPSSDEEPGNTAATPNYSTLVERQTSHPQTRFTPCNLVTQSQAEAIIGRPMQRPLEAPQGPTCIYRSRHGAAYISLAVQTASYARLRR